MNFRQKITLSLFLTIVLGGVAFAQVVDIPDPNLRTAIADALGIARGAPITREDINRLTRLDAQNRNIASLVGLETATNLTTLYISENPITDLNSIAGLVKLKRLSIWGILGNDITPIANLTNLEFLEIAGCSISDITALSNLINLTNLNARHNRIVDISPLANLKNLAILWLSHNRITDVSPLAGLARLEFLEIHSNRITDHSPLDAIALSHFTYDQTCEMPALPLEPRLENRTFPSVVALWGSVLNQSHLSPIEQASQHDLIIDYPGMFGHSTALSFIEGAGWQLRGDLEIAEGIRDEYLVLNPNIIFLASISMREESIDAHPKDWPYWVRDSDNEPVSGWPGTYLMNFTHPYVQDMIVQKALAIERCGLFDGIMFDWWHEGGPILADYRSGWSHGYVGNDAEQHARDNILRRIRIHARPNFLIMGNTNRRKIPRTGPHINGGFMETLVPADKTGDNLETLLAEIESSLLWLDTNLREPRINALEGWSVPSEAADGSANLRWMRAFTTLSLTHSDGYVVFQHGYGSHNHYWYDFWDADLGQPVGEKGQLYQETEGLYIREFTNGWAVYNHSGSHQQITLPEIAVGVASRLEGNTHTLSDIDGEMYLRVKPINPADVNDDGVVNILDLTLVAQAFGKDGLQGDVNGDGVVNVFDLVFVANQF